MCILSVCGCLDEGERVGRKEGVKRGRLSAAINELYTCVGLVDRWEGGSLVAS